MFSPPSHITSSRCLLIHGREAEGKHTKVHEYTKSANERNARDNTAVNNDWSQPHTDSVKYLQQRNCDLDTSEGNVQVVLTSDCKSQLLSAAFKFNSRHVHSNWDGLISNVQVTNLKSAKYKLCPEQNKWSDSFVKWLPVLVMHLRKKPVVSQLLRLFFYNKSRIEIKILSLEIKISCRMPLKKQLYLCYKGFHINGNQHPFIFPLQEFNET